MQASAKNRPLSAAALEQIAAEIDESLRLEGPEVTSQQVGLAVLEALRSQDHVAYLRFASVYKDFTEAVDFEREVGLLDQVDNAQRPKGARSKPAVPGEGDGAGLMPWPGGTSA